MLHRLGRRSGGAEDAALGAGSRRRRRARADVHGSTADVRLALWREPALLEGPLRARAPGRADRRAARAPGRAGAAAGRRPDRVAARRAEGRRPGRRRRRLRPGRIQHQRDGDLAGPRPRRRAHRVGAHDGGRCRAVVVQRRRVRQLHAGRRADRACARRIRRRGVRAPPGRSRSGTTRATSCAATRTFPRSRRHRESSASRFSRPSGRLRTSSCSPRRRRRPARETRSPPSAAGCRWSGSTRSTSSRARAARRACSTSSRDAAS